MYGPYVRVESREAWERAMALAKGRFQRCILNGDQSVSLPELKWASRRIVSSYVTSLEHLLVRVRKAGILIGEERDEYGRQRLVIGDPEVCYRIGNYRSHEFVEMPPRDSGVAVAG
jgi:hypothetical protein